MPTRKIVNAHKVFSEYIVRQLQQRLGGKGMLVYIPALPAQGEAPYNLRMVADFTGQGWSAARIAARLDISARQIQRLCREARDHPERLAPNRPPAQEDSPPTTPTASPTNNDIIQIPHVRPLSIDREW